jgi:hypothetical protein
MYSAVDSIILVSIYMRGGTADPTSTSTSYTSLFHLGAVLYKARLKLYRGAIRDRVRGRERALSSRL